MVFCLITQGEAIQSRVGMISCFYTDDRGLQNIVLCDTIGADSSQMKSCREMLISSGLK